MVAKELEWNEITPEVFEDFAHIAPIEVLRLNDGPAHYRVNKVAGCLKCQLWVGNRAFGLGNWLESADAGKTICQNHFNLMILCNSR